MFFDKAFQFVLKQEGGYSNENFDRGGASNLGITHIEYLIWLDSCDLPQKDIKDITLSEARAIYRTTYWNSMQCDHLPEKTALLLFDTGINMGIGIAVKMLQRLIGVPEDGVVGPKTLAAAYNKEIITLYLAARISRYHYVVATDPTQQIFLEEWLQRVEDLRKLL